MYRDAKFFENYLNRYAGIYLKALAEYSQIITQVPGLVIFQFFCIILYWPN